MITTNLIQGTPEWHAHRAQYFNASEAPAMMGASQYMTRTALLDLYKKGVSPEFSKYVQEKVINPGHSFEALARPLAEKIIGEDLYPCTGTEGRYSASFDGLTLLGDAAWEHKSLNDGLRSMIVNGKTTGLGLPLQYQIQMQHQCMVSGVDRVLFMASEWEGDKLVEERHCWYASNLDLEDKIIAGWAQFEVDLVNHVPTTIAPSATGHAPDQLPTLHIELTGMVTASNLIEFRDQAIAVFQGISTDLQTDQDFADAEKTVKWCSDIEDRLKAAKDHALSQTQSIDELFRAIDSISAEARGKRLELDKLVKVRKESIRAEIVAEGCTEVREHYRTINATIGAQHVILPPQSLQLEIGAAIKGKKSISSMRDAVNTAVAFAKISASQRVDAVRLSIAALDEASAGYESLFADRVQLCAGKAPDDIRNLAAARIAAHKVAEEAKEAARAAHLVATEASAQISMAASVASAPATAAAPPAPSATASTARIKLGEINARIAPLSISAEGLSQLGFNPVGKAGAAKLYAESDWASICTALMGCISMKRGA